MQVAGKYFPRFLKTILLALLFVFGSGSFYAAWPLTHKVPSEMRLKGNSFNIPTEERGNVKVEPVAFVSKKVHLMYTKKPAEDKFWLENISAKEMAESTLVAIFSGILDGGKEFGVGVAKSYLDQLLKHQYAYPLSQLVGVGGPLAGSSAYLYLMFKDQIDPWISDYKSELEKYKIFIETYSDDLSGINGIQKQSQAITQLAIIGGSAFVTKKISNVVKNSRVKAVLREVVEGPRFQPAAKQEAWIRYLEKDDKKWANDPDRWSKHYDSLEKGGGVVTKEVSLLGKITQGMPSYTPGQLRHFQNLFNKSGAEKLLQSRETFTTRIAEHLEKIRTATGYTSSMEREIRNFQQQINAIDKILGR